jgi:hypothetical protein
MEELMVTRKFETWERGQETFWLVIYIYRVIMIFAAGHFFPKSNSGARRRTSKP